jgi:hypothetical protein
LQTSRGWGWLALAADLQTLDTAKLHDQILIARVMPGQPANPCDRLIAQEGKFFAQAHSLRPEKLFPSFGLPPST